MKVSKKTPYMVIISTRTGTTIRLTNPPAALPELLRFIQDIELADIRAQESKLATLQKPQEAAQVPQETAPGPEPVPEAKEPPPEPQEPTAAQEKEEVPEEKPADPRRSRFITLF